MVVVHHLYTSPLFSLLMFYANSLVFLSGSGFFKGSRLSASLLKSLMSLISTNPHIEVSLELHSDPPIGFKDPLWFLWIILSLYVFYRTLPATFVIEPTNSHTIQSINTCNTYTYIAGINLYIDKYEQLITYRDSLSPRPGIQYQWPPSFALYP